jgi:hypothetical protein
MVEFIPGLELSRLFFVECVQPVLSAEYPDLPYDAALIGSGSEVLGFDTALSRDHHWGPRVTLYVTEADYERHAEAIREMFRYKLPYEIRGYPTSFEEIPDEPGILRFEPKTSGPVNHRIEVTTVRRFLRGYLDWELSETIDAADWLTFPQQKLRTLVAGAVYHAGLGDVPAMRQQFAWYPQDVWLYLMAAGWMRISQEEPFVGRTGDVGDELGSRILAARLVRGLMQLAFLIERQYAPYAKWFGTAFARLVCAASLMPIFERVFNAQHWREREQGLAAAYSILAGMHNALGVTEPLPTEPSGFFDRPYMVIHGERFSEALAGQIQDTAVRGIAGWIGSIDQFSDSTDLLEATMLRQRLKGLYG